MKEFAWIGREKSMQWHLVVTGNLHCKESKTITLCRFTAFELVDDLEYIDGICSQRNNDHGVFVHGLISLIVASGKKIGS